MNKKSNKNIFILHSLNGDTLKIWGQDVKKKFGKKMTVFMPQFPIRAESTYARFDVILAEYLKEGLLNDNSVVIAHSIGNAYFMRFCKEHNYEPNTYIAVAPGAVYEYPTLRNDYIIEVSKQAYVTEEILNYMKKAKSIKYCFYSDEDDNNLEKFTRFINDIHAEGIYLKNYNHFDGYHNINEIPKLIELLNKLI